jgi:hypothetical protein
MLKVEPRLQNGRHQILIPIQAIIDFEFTTPGSKAQQQAQKEELFQIHRVLIQKRYASTYGAKCKRIVIPTKYGSHFWIASSFCCNHYASKGDRFAFAGGDLGDFTPCSDPARQN